MWLLQLRLGTTLSTGYSYAGCVVPMGLKPVTLKVCSIPEWTKSRSLENGSFSMMIELRESCEEARLIICLWKVQPGGTTFAAKERSPMSDKSSFLVAEVLEDYSARAILMFTSLSSGKHVSRLIESRMMSRNLIEWVGHSSFSSASGTPIRENASSRWWRLLLHSEADWAMVKKWSW